MRKTILISGASSGVGESIAKKFLELDWNVIGLGRDSSKMAALLEFPNFKCFQVDISNFSDVEKVFNGIDSVDILINNAAIFITKPIEAFTETEINSIIDTNLKGTIFCTIQCIKKMKAGRVINISSVSGLHGIPNQAIYSSSKFGVMGFTESISQENTGIGFTTICPGGIDTPLWNENNPYHGDRTRLLKPEDIAKTVEYVASLPVSIVLKNITMFPDNEWH